MNDIALLVIAQNIEKKVVERFCNFANKSKDKHDFDIVIDYGGGDVFSKSKLLNNNIKRLVESYKYIVQTDIDLIIPFGLVDKSLQVLSNWDNPFIAHCVLRYIKEDAILGKEYEEFPWETWKSQDHTYCSGCWNMANSRTWKRSGGWNPEMFGWGAEDTEFRERSRRRGVNWRNIYDYPLVHIHHEPRSPKRGEENSKLADKFDKKEDFLFGPNAKD